MRYHLVFVLLWQDFKLPLVQSQTFDQAQEQSEISGEFKPISVSVWVLTPLRFFMWPSESKTIEQLRTRCPGITVRFIPGIDRLGKFPSRWIVLFLRMRIQDSKVVFHFRGEASMHYFRKQYNKRSFDIFVLDVRGYWPAEMLYNNGIEDITNLPTTMKRHFDLAINSLKEALILADGVITVSNNLAELLRELFKGIIDINVTPCCIRSISTHEQRDLIRYQLGVLEDEKLLVYSGGYARYQHLEDLTVPFFKLLMRKDPKIKALILSQDIQKIKPIVEGDVASQGFIFLKVPQQVVASYLSACDLGFLVRKPTLVNTVAQPVKVGEYLGAGVPVCVEGQVGGVTEKLLAYSAGISINISNKEFKNWDDDAEIVLNFLKEKDNKGRNAKKLAEDYFLWKANIPRQRDYYYHILSNARNPIHS